MPYVPGMVQGVRDTKVHLCRTKNIHPQAIPPTLASFLSPFPSHSKRRELFRGFLNVKLGLEARSARLHGRPAEKVLKNHLGLTHQGRCPQPTRWQTATNTVFT